MKVGAPEPFRIKVVEPISLISREERLTWLKKAHYNLFLVPSRAIFIDLLTDSGTSAMSHYQWSALMMGDEAYAGARSWERLYEKIKEITGFPYVLPTHQGRAAEHLLIHTLAKPGDLIPSNNHFDTTRANIEAVGAKALDFVIEEAKDLTCLHPFKGNMDVEKLDQLLKKEKEKVPFIFCTITNNTAGGQPVSLANLKDISTLAKKYQKPFFLDACRYAENAYFIQKREKGMADLSVKAIARKIFDLADGCTFSGKKDGLVNIGGFLALRSEELASRLSEPLILKEGFLTYGGMAGRDLEALAVGMEEALHETYLAYRIDQTARFATWLKEASIPILEPPGGHAVYIDAGSFFPHIPPEHFPGQTLTIALYLEGAIRGVEIGSVMFGDKAMHQLVRLAIPRRVYTDNHLAYVVEVFKRIQKKAQSYPGMKITQEPRFLRHFTAHFEPLHPFPES